MMNDKQKEIEKSYFEKMWNIATDKESPEKAKKLATWTIMQHVMCEDLIKPNKVKLDISTELMGQILLNDFLKSLEM
jgi:hypothetical protein